jgi:hypothetical protein
VSRMLALVAGVILLLAAAGTVLAWERPQLTSACAPDEEHYAWVIHLGVEDNFIIQWSFAADFSGSQQRDFGTAGDHAFVTPRGGPTLYVRFASDHQARTQADANAELCQGATPTPTPTPSPTPEQHEQGGTPTPTPEENVHAGTGTPAASLPNSATSAGQGTPWAVLSFVLVLLGSLTGLATVNARVPRRKR